MDLWAEGAPSGFASNLESGTPDITDDA